MPNWCRGTLIIKGTKDNVKSFLLENLKANDLDFYEDNWKLTIRSNQGFYIDGTKKNFVNDNIEFYFATEETNKECSMNGFMAAWSIDPEPYVQISRKYDIDIDIGGTEIYGGFAQEIKIQKGEIIIDKVEKINLDFRAEDEEFMDEDFSFVEAVPSVNDGQDKCDDLPF